MCRFAVVIAWLLLAAAPAFASLPPTLDIGATCRRAVPLLGDGDNSPYQGCVQDEAEAQRELVKSWATFTPSAQRICAQETRIGGAPSYVELLTCLQLDQQAREAARENNAAMASSGGSADTSGTMQPR